MFIIVRHGDTFEPGERPRRIGARTDLSLTASGMIQADALGAHFAARDWHFARVLVSPLTRTQQTARAMLRHLPAAPVSESCDWLREIDHGPDEDMPEDLVLARIGAAALTAWDERAEPPPGWVVDAEARVAAWRALFAHQSGLTLIVTSNGAARFALKAIEPAQARLPGGLKLPTGAYGVIRKGAAGQLEVAEWGKRP